MHCNAERFMDDCEACGSEAAVLKIAEDLNANSACVLLVSGSRSEVALCVPEEIRERLIESLARAASAPEMERAVPGLLKTAIASISNSFLICTRDVASCSVIFAFGFADPRPPYSIVPPAIAEGLSPVAYALWAARQLQTLRTELRVVNQKLAGRKLVERAKAVLEARLAIDEQRAYELLRKTSRKRRIAMTSLAEEIIRRDAAGLKLFAD